jgi:hypothetical protein
MATELTFAKSSVSTLYPRFRNFHSITTSYSSFQYTESKYITCGIPPGEILFKLSLGFCVQQQFHIRQHLSAHITEGSKERVFRCNLETGLPIFTLGIQICQTKLHFHTTDVDLPEEN